MALRYPLGQVGLQSEMRRSMLCKHTSCCLHQVVLGTTEGGSVFGAYNPKGWIGEHGTALAYVLHSSFRGSCHWLWMLRRTGLGEERNALSAFLFCWPDGNLSRPPEKLVKARCRQNPHQGVPDDLSQIVCQKRGMQLQGDS